VLSTQVVPYFDNHPLTDRPHRARIVRVFRQEALDTFQWSAMSLDVKPIEHVWDFIGLKVNQRNPHCQNIAKLTNAILEEWR
jgi:hypothetical protein